MKRLLLLLLVGLTVSTYAQLPVFVKDSIMNIYMVNGFATKNFEPKGPTDAKKQRQGEWKDYEVKHDFMYINSGGTPKNLVGTYVIYGEGTFTDGKRTGPWKLYVLEDKTFKKILQMETVYSNGYKNGPFTYYYPSGAKGATGTFSLDMPDDTFTSYYENGTLYSTCSYSMGLETGRHITYYPTGITQTDCTYTDGKQDGIYQSFYANGVLQQKFGVKMGNEDGQYQYFYENGQLWIEKEYKNGLLMNVKANYTAKGKERDKGTLKDGNGTVIYYTEEGKVYSIQTFKDGDMVSENKKMPEPKFYSNLH